MQFDVVDAPGAYECFKCGGEVVAYGSVNANGKPYYFIRCEVCSIQGASGTSVEMAVKFWNTRGEYDGEKMDFIRHTKTWGIQGQGESGGEEYVNVRLKRLEERIARFNEDQAASRARKDARKNAKEKEGKVGEEIQGDDSQDGTETLPG